MNIKPVKYRTTARALWLVILLYIGSSVCAQSGSDLNHAGGKDYYRIDSIILSGNKITKDQIIFREIVFNTGDSLRSDRIDTLITRSRQNLMNTSLFNFVEIQKTFPDPGKANMVIKVKVTERWYIWPTPILKLSDRNFNVWWQTKDLSRLSYGFYIDWRNFRGRKENLILRFQWGYNRVIVLQLPNTVPE